MSFYDKVVLPRLLDLVMRNSRLATYRHATIRAARGRALEFGVGSGLNLPMYEAGVDQVCGIDPSHELLDRTSKRLADARRMLVGFRRGWLVHHPQHLGSASP